MPRARSKRPAGASMTTREPGMSIVGTMASTKGICASTPSLRRRTRRSCAARVVCGQADQIILIPPVLGVIRLLGEQLCATQRFSACSVRDLVEGQQPDPVVGSGGTHREGLGDAGPGRGLSGEGGPRREPAGRVVGVQAHRHLAVETVRLADSGDEDIHAHQCPIAAPRLDLHRTRTPTSSKRPDRGPNLESCPASWSSRTNP